MKRTAKAAKFIICLILVFGMSVQAAFGATVTITNLTSPTHPPGTWVSSPNPQFTWETSIDPVPTLLGSIDTHGAARDIAIDGTTAYVADGDSGLKMIDISNPAAPVLLGSIDTPGTAEGIVVSGTTAFVADGASGIQVIDVSNPSSPSLLGSLGMSGHAFDVAVSLGVLYVAAGDSGLLVADVSDPRAPILFGAYDTPGKALGITISGMTAFVADGDCGLRVIDISNPSALNLLQIYDTSGVAYSVSVLGRNAYVADGDSGIQVIDVWYPQRIVLLSTYDTPGSARGVAVSGTTVYVADHGSGIQVIDVSDPTSPCLLSSLDTGGEARGLALSGATAYVVDGDAGMHAIDVRNPWEPSFLGNYRTEALAYDVAVLGTTAHVAAGRAGLQLVDVSNPSSPSPLGSWDTYGNALGIAVSGTTAYVADGDAGLQLIDVSDPSAPAPRGSYKLPSQATGVAVSGTTAYVAAGYSGLWVFDVSDPWTPKPIGFHPLDILSVDVAISGATAYVADLYSGLQVVDVSNPKTPTLVGALDTPGGAIGVVVSGATAYVAAGFSGLQVVDVSNPRAPTLLGSFAAPGMAVDVAVSGTTAYLASDYSGIRVIDVSDRSAPRLLGAYPISSIRGIATSCSTVYVAGFTFGLQVLSLGPGYSWVVSGAAATVPDAVIDGWNRAASRSKLADGIHYFSMRPASGARACETRTFQFRIDTKPPSTTPSGAVDSTGGATVSLAATDAASGLASTRFILDGGAVTTYTAPFAVSTVGTRTLRYFSVDAAGNREATRTVTFTIARSGVSVTSTQVAGLTRYDTAVAASRRAFPAGAATVVIASGENWPDAMGGTALAGAVDGPILLVHPNALPAAVAAEIRRLGASKAYILGGKGAVSPVVESAVKAIVGAGNVRRLAGDTRFETSAKIASETIGVLGPDYDGTAFVATGGNFPDALSAAPIAAAKGWPIFLAKPASIDSAAMAGLGVTDVVILGGRSVVSPSLETALEGRFGAANVDRIWGADRYATSAQVAAFGVNTAGLGWNGVGLTLGTNFPDGLAGGAMLGQSNSVMMLVAPTSLPAPVGDALAANRNVIANVVYLGGTGAIPQTVRNQVEARLR